MDNNIGSKKRKILVFSVSVLILCGLAAGIIRIAGSEKLMDTDKEEIQPVVKDEKDSAADISGEWLITDVIESCSYESYIGLRLEFRVFFRQDKGTFTAEGKKIRENERELPLSQRTPIFIEGTVDGNTVRGDIVEHGKKRKTGGQFIWNLAETGRMIGTFRSEAADSAGSSVAIRVR